MEAQQQGHVESGDPDGGEELRRCVMRTAMLVLLCVSRRGRLARSAKWERLTVSLTGGPEREEPLRAV